jgi:hypothetical protein
MHIRFEHDFFKRTDILPFFSNGLLMDTGPLYLFLVGRHYPEKLNDFGYSKEEFEYLDTFLSGIPYKKLVITPHIFHELYKHVQKIFGGCNCFIEKMKEDLIIIEEEYVKKNEILNCCYFKFFEIGEHSLYLAFGKSPTAILTDSKRYYFCDKLKDDPQKLVMDFKQEIIPYIDNIS